MTSLLCQDKLGIPTQSTSISTQVQHGTESCLYFAILHCEGEGVTQNSKLKLFTKVQHQHLSSHAVDDEKMICFDQNYLTTKWGIMIHYLAKTPSEIPTEVYWFKWKFFPKPAAHQSLVWVWLKYRNYNLSYSWLSSQSPPGHPPPVILESQSIMAHQLGVSHCKADSRCEFF